MKALTKEQQEKFKEVTRPLIQYMSENHHPYCVIIVTDVSAELFESQINNHTEDFIKD